MFDIQIIVVLNYYINLLLKPNSSVILDNWVVLNNLALCGRYVIDS